MKTCMTKTLAYRQIYVKAHIKFNLARAKRDSPLCPQIQKNYDTFHLTVDFKAYLIQ